VQEITPQGLAAHIDACIARSGKSNRQVAEECGFSKPNVISMIRYGTTKLPLAKASRMAQALGEEPKEFVELAFRAYQPEIWQVIESTYLVRPEIA